ncbi:MAG: ABC transporter ATP-binding protein [Lachnospiraceae bacterium]|nr:ABC transporter ATP-binding protein [Lachnospiraceae bacterium]
MYAIQIEELTKYYGKARGIIDLSLTVREGEFFGFIGPNGAGKSTTIRTLLGLIRPTSGQVKILGRDISKDKNKILAEIGYLPSETVFYPGMRVKDILRLSARLRKQDCQAEAQMLCDRLQLDVNKKAEELSFGNRKKAGIVAALQHKPRLLILDEPTSGLDPLMQREFFAILRERNEQGTAVFLSSHVLSEVQNNCTRAAIIREGRMIACGNVEALARTNARRITIHGQAELDGLEGVRDRKEEAGAVSFLYSGDIRLLLGKLARGNITDLSVTEPKLEEIFLHYYEKGGDGNDTCKA